MTISEIIIRMENLCNELEVDRYTCCTHQWSKGYRKGYVEAVNTIKLMLESQEIPQPAIVVAASITPDNSKEVDNHEERKEVGPSQPRRYAIRA